VERACDYSSIIISSTSASSPARCHGILLHLIVCQCSMAAASAVNIICTHILLMYVLSVLGVFVAR